MKHPDEQVKILRRDMSRRLRRAAYLNDEVYNESLIKEMDQICYDWQLLNHEIRKGIEAASAVSGIGEE